jgi:hypothetical protein
MIPQLCLILLLAAGTPQNAASAGQSPGEGGKDKGTLSLEQVKAELRDILQEQRDRQREVGVLLEQVEKAGSIDVLKKDPHKANLKKTVKLQRELGDRMEEAVKRIAELQEKVQGQDKALGLRLAAAAKIALDPQNFQSLAMEMRSSSELLHDEFDAPPKKTLNKPWVPQLGRTHKQQANSIQTLEAMLKVLEGVGQSKVDGKR